MSTLKSGIEKELKGEFILDEQALRRIVGVLEQKAKDLDYPTILVFHVKRVDDRFYETTKIDDVLADPNIQDRKIHSLSIELRNEDPNKKPEPWERDWFVLVRFVLKENLVIIAVGHEDKNWALLLVDELEPQIMRTKVAKKIPTWILVMFYFAMALFFVVITRKYSVYLPKSIFDFSRNLIYFCVILISFLSFGNRPEFLSRFVGPNSCFHWGDQLSVYSDKERLRQNLQWIVIIGFLLSICTTIYTAYINLESFKVF